MNRASRLFSFILSIIMLSTSLFSVNFLANAEDYASELKEKGFEESYIDDLVELHNKHPRWNFEVLNTNLEWDDAVEGERKYHNQQLIENSLENEYFCNCANCATWNEQTQSYDYNTFEGSTWVSASQKAVMHYIDPRNFLNESDIFQFQSVKYSESETIDGIEGIIGNTFMHNADIAYIDSNGELQTFYIDGQTVKYSKAIMDAAEECGLSAYYLAFKIVSEVGGAQNTAIGASGSHNDYKGIYNYYNIGGNGDGETALKWASKPNVSQTNIACNIRQQPWIEKNQSNRLGIVNKSVEVNILSETGQQSDGFTWYNVDTVLKDGSNVNGYIRSDFVDVPEKEDDHGRPWNNPYSSILNGAKYIAQGFPEYQFTSYLRKFNVNNVEGNALHSHEFMVNVRSAVEESERLYNENIGIGALDSVKTFYIPVFKNMPKDKVVMDSDVKVENLRTYDICSTKLAYTWDELDNAVSYIVRYDNNTTNTSSVLTVTSEEFAANGKILYIEKLNKGDSYTIYVKPVCLNTQTNEQFEGNEVAISNVTSKTLKGWTKVNDDYFYYDSIQKHIYSNCWQIIDNEYYFFNPNGALAHDTLIQSSQYTYYLDGNGHIVKNSWVDISGDLHYLDNEGHLAKNTIISDDNGIRYLDSNGFVIKDQWIDDSLGKCLADENGYLVTNRIVEQNDSKIYLNENGRIVKDTWIELDGNNYYINSEGYVLCDDIVETDSAKYYLNQDGTLACNSWITYDGSRMYTNGDGTIATSTVVVDENGLVYLDENGKTTKNRWALSNGTDWVYVNNDGYIATNKYIIDLKDYCYVDENGVRVTDRWFYIHKGWIYFDSTGHIARKTIITDDNGSFYLNREGLVVYNNWVKSDGNWYYFGEDGYMLKNSFVDDSKGTCYVDENGIKVYDKWIDDENGSHYIDKRGHLSDK